MSIAEDLRELAKLRREATKGPWERDKTVRSFIGGQPHTSWPIVTAYEVAPGWGIGCAVVILPDEDDSRKTRKECRSRASFIASCGNLTPERLAALAELVEAALEHRANLRDFDPDKVTAAARKIRRAAERIATLEAAS